MRKSLVTNLVAAFVVAIGWFLEEPLRGPVLSTGLFALSGALTNWVAVHMLFERIPGLYGSGVIQLRFAEFKDGIHTLIMRQFFTRENMERLLELERRSGGPPIDASKLDAAIDYDEVFEKVRDAVMESRLGGMLGMFGGASALEPLRDPVKEKLGAVVREVLASPRFQEALEEGLSGGTLYDELLDKVDRIVKARLEELSPSDVKRIIQDMIREHLGWLVVWGGVFGGLLGLLASGVLT